MADLKDLPIGTHFWYLQRMFVVIAYDGMPDEEVIKCNYVDDRGVVRVHYFEQPSFDFLLNLVKTAREAEAREANERLGF
jgi:hypothetical protein